MFFVLFWVVGLGGFYFGEGRVSGLGFYFGVLGLEFCG